MKEEAILSYADIAEKLGVTTSQLQNYVKWHQRHRDKRAFKPDGVGVATTAPGHRFTESKAQRIADAYTKQRILKAWKKTSETK